MLIDLLFNFLVFLVCILISIAIKLRATFHVVGERILISREKSSY